MKPEIHFVRVVDEEGWQAVRAIRQVVVVEEQECPPEEEWDGVFRAVRK